jgi:hypothetical protein
VLLSSTLLLLFGAGHCAVDLTLIKYVQGILGDWLPQGKSFFNEKFDNPHLGAAAGFRHAASVQEGTMPSRWAVRRTWRGKVTKVPADIEFFIMR